MEEIKYMSRDEYDAILQEQYNALESNDIIHLLNQTRRNILETSGKNDKTEFIESVIRNAIQYRKLSFKQWKALKAFNRDCVKDTTDVKTF